MTNDKTAFYWMAIGAGARSVAMKLHVLCEPSQNGLFFDWPQRQWATAGLSGAILNVLPEASTIVTGPSTRNGPLSRTLIVTCDMHRVPGASSWETRTQCSTQPLTTLPASFADAGSIG